MFRQRSRRRQSLASLLERQELPPFGGLPLILQSCPDPRTPGDSLWHGSRGLRTQSVAQERRSQGVRVLLESPPAHPTSYRERRLAHLQRTRDPRVSDSVL